MEDLDFEQVNVKLGEIFDELQSTFSFVSGLQQTLDNGALIQLPADIDTDAIVVAVDGGERTQNLFGSALIVCSAASLVFHNGCKPRIFRSQDFDLTATPSSSINQYTSLIRTELEIKSAMEAITAAVEMRKQIQASTGKENNILLLMDGTITQLFTTGLRTLTITKIIRTSEEAIQTNHKSNTSNNSSDKNNVPLLTYDDKYKIHFDNKSQLLDELLHYCLKEKVIILGLSKDSFRTSLVKKKLNTNAITDISYLHLLFRNQEGYIIDNGSKPHINYYVSDYWNRNGWLTDKTLLEITTFYVISKANAVPFRLDILQSQVDLIEEALKGLLTYSDGAGWFVPPQLAHQNAKMNDTFFQFVLTQISKLALEKNQALFDLFLQRTRRDTIQ